MNKKIEKLVILVFIIIIALIIVIYNLLSDEDYGGDNNVSSNVSEEDIPDEGIYNSVFSGVIDRNDYFSVKNIIETYFLYIKYVNGDMSIDTSRVEDADEYMIELRNNGILAIQNMFDEEYIANLNNIETAITEEANKYTVDGSYFASNVDYTINIENMYVTQLDTNILLFLVELNVRDISLNILVKLDLRNRTFSIFLSDYIEQYGYNTNMSEEEITIDSSEIEENDNNTFNYNTISDEDMSREYFNILKYLYLYDSERLYNLLDEEYSNARFGNYENFQEYIQDITDKMNNSTLYRYQVSYQSETNTVIYRLMDNYDIVYTFEVGDYILDFDVQLDDYTIESTSFVELYNEAEDQEKVQTNIETFFKMINTKDYNAAYNVLNDTFKQNNFPTVDEFKEYAQNNFFDNTTITSVEDISQSGTYYACTITTASDDSDTAETREETFIVALGNDTDFTLSFTVE